MILLLLLRKASTPEDHRGAGSCCRDSRALLERLEISMLLLIASCAAFRSIAAVGLASLPPIP
jgi:hypothetical protein